jgi:type I restriction enzyme, S subunit
MKTDWKTKPLEDVSQFSNGLWKGEKPPFVNVGVIRNTNFTKEGTLDDSDIAYLDVEVKKLERRRLRFGDIILEKSGGGPKQPVGRVALFDKEDGDFSFSNFTAALRVLDARELDFRFLHKFLHWIYLSGITEGMQSHSTGIRNLDGDAYRAIKISFPSLPEQRRIVGILDEAFAGIATAEANTEKNLQNARALFDSHLHSVFTQRGLGWKERAMGEVCEVKDGTHDSPKYVDDGIPFVTQKNIREDGLSFEKVKFIKQEDHDDFYRRSNVAYGDILISMIGANRGMACVVDDERTFSIKNVGLVKQSPSINQQFLLHFLKSPRAASYVQAASKGGAQEFVGLTELRRFPIPLPSLECQNTLAENFQSLHGETQHLESIYQQKLDALDALKKSLLHQAFAGEL